MANGETVLDLFGTAKGEHLAVIVPETGVRVTYRDLREQVAEMADSLAAMGVRRGDRIATSFTNGLPSIVTFLAAAMVGTAAPLNPVYREKEVMFFLHDIGAKLLLCSADATVAQRACGMAGVPCCIMETNASGFVRMAKSSVGKTASDPSPDDVALILHTSGSTGTPKRVPLTHRNLAASTRSIVAHYSLSPADVSFCAMPLFHVHGLIASTLSTLRSGGTVVVPGKFNPLTFWRTVRETEATWYSAVPMIHSLLLARAGGSRPAAAGGLRFIRSCSAALPAETMRQMEGTFGVPVLEAYGMTEAAHQITSNPLPPGKRKPGSVGSGTGVQVNIMDQGGCLLAAGQKGEIVIQGTNVFASYENNPQENEKCFTQGWFRTGDQGCLDSDGSLTITGRLKEMINRGGEKIAPGEIDRVLMSHPGIADAVSFGVPHAVWGEEVAAAIVLSGDCSLNTSESAILSYCRDQLADYKCPVKLHFTKSIPRTATGKVQRGVIAKSVAAA